MTYRSDIDGLRAIAVMLVVLFHCGFEGWIPGGYIGVDVFFVISGYLITKILFDEALSGTLSLWKFYERRARRIFPALIAMYIFVLTGSFLVLLPSEVFSQSKNILSSILFSSNIYFYYEYDYFNAASEFNSVLHTWSLSVEEQFYIFFPPLLFVLVTRRPRSAGLALLGIAFISLCLSQLRLGTDPSAVFYMVWYRAWELLLGSVVAVGFLPKVRSLALASTAGVLGLLLILGSGLLLNRSSSFPGLAALPSCLGSALIIWAGQTRQTLVGWGLSIAPARFVGKISYSLYLWHWPIWVLGRQLYEPQSLVGRSAYLALMLLVASLSWKFIEQPFRRPAYNISSRRVVGVGVSALALVAVVSIAAPYAASVAWQVPPRVEEVAQFINYRPDKEQRVGTCFLTSVFKEFNQFDKEKCLALDSTRHNYLLMGDSHAAQYYPGLLQFADLNILQATASGCRPTGRPEGAERCTRMVGFIMKDFLPAHHLDAVIIAARWQTEDLMSLGHVISELKNSATRVIVVGPIVEYQKALPRLLAKALYRGEPELPSLFRTEGRAQLDRRMRDVVTAGGGEYISAIDALCPDGRCDLWTADNNPIQADYGHLTAAGSKLVISRLSNAIHGVTLGVAR